MQDLTVQLVTHLKQTTEAPKNTFKPQFRSKDANDKSNLINNINDGVKQSMKRRELFSSLVSSFGKKEEKTRENRKTTIF